MGQQSDILVPLGWQEGGIRGIPTPGNTWGSFLSICSFLASTHTHLGGCNELLANAAADPLFPRWRKIPEAGSVFLRTGKYIYLKVLRKSKKITKIYWLPFWLQMWLQMVARTPCSVLGINSSCYQLPWPLLINLACGLSIAEKKTVLISYNVK